MPLAAMNGFVAEEKHVAGAHGVVGELLDAGAVGVIACADGVLVGDYFGIHGVVAYLVLNVVAPCGVADRTRMQAVVAPRSVAVEGSADLGKVDAMYFRVVDLFNEFCYQSIAQFIVGFGVCRTGQDRLELDFGFG